MDHLSRVSSLGWRAILSTLQLSKKSAGKPCSLPDGQGTLDCTKKFPAMVSPACPFAVSGARIPQAIPLKSPAPRCRMGLAGYQRHRGQGRGWGWGWGKWPMEWQFVWPSFSLHSVMSAPKMSWLPERNWNWFTHGPSLWLLTQDWSTELLFPGLAWGTLGWLTTSPGMQLVWNAAQGPRCPQGAGLSKGGRSFPKQSEDPHS